MGVTESLINYLTSTNYEDLPEEVVLAAKRAVMDTIGVVLGGSSRDGCTQLVSLVAQWRGKPEATVFASGLKVPAHDAALVNGTMARALDFDDCHIHTAAHPSATIVPVALACAEIGDRISGKELITAVVLGTEVTIRLRAVPDSCNLTSGWSGEVHSTFGAAATAGKLLRVGAAKMGHALGLAYCQAAGNLQPVADGALASRLQQGFAARSGLLSAVLASRGITGPRDFLDGRFGFYPVYYRGMAYELARLLEHIGERYEILNVAAKPYPCCAYAHGPIENLLAIMQENQLSLSDIDEVLLRLNQRMYGLCTPPEVKWRPRTVVDAMFSLPYAVGTAMLRGDVFLPDFSDDAIREPDRLQAVDRVKALVDDEVDAESQRNNLPLSLNVVEVRTKSGGVFSRKMLHVKGYPQRPMTLEDAEDKLRRCARFSSRHFSEAVLENIVSAVRHLENLEDAGYLAGLLHGGRRQSSGNWRRRAVPADQVALL